MLASCDDLINFARRKGSLWPTPSLPTPLLQMAIPGISTGQRSAKGPTTGGRSLKVCALHQLQLIRGSAIGATRLAAEVVKDLEGFVPAKLRPPQGQSSSGKLCCSCCKAKWPHGYVRGTTKQRLRCLRRAGRADEKNCVSLSRTPNYRLRPYHRSRNKPLSYPSRLRLHAKAVKQIGETSPHRDR